MDKPKNINAAKIGKIAADTGPSHSRYQDATLWDDATALARHSRRHSPTQHPGGLAFARRGSIVTCRCHRRATSKGPSC